jgi:hypothetical protein
VNAPIWRWEMTQAYDKERAEKLAADGWEPYATLRAADGSVVFFLKRAVKVE